LPALRGSRPGRHRVVDRGHRHALVGADGPDAPPRREGAGSGPVAVGHADRGELEAVYSPPRPQAYHPVDGPLARLFPDFRGVERAYFEKTGAFPPQHLVVIRRGAWQAHRWIAKSLTEAFIAGNDCFTAAQKGFPYATPWLEAELEDTAAV